MRVVQGDTFIQLERRGLHHINIHAGHTIDDDDDAQPQDLIDDSEDIADFDDYDDSKEEHDSYDEDHCQNSSENSSYGIQSKCLP